MSVLPEGWVQWEERGGRLHNTAILNVDPGNPLISPEPEVSKEGAWEKVGY